MEKDISIYDLAYYVVANASYNTSYTNLLSTLSNKPIPQPLRQAALQSIANLIRKHWHPKDILSILSKNKIIFENNQFNIENMFVNEKRTLYNLIVPFRVYFHNELRLSSKPGITNINYDTGEVTTIENPYFLEMKAGFTLENLTMYFLNKPTLYESEIINKGNKLTGTFKWLLKNYDLELILYMIDYCNDTIGFENKKKLINAMDIQKHFLDAKETYQRKWNECKQIGGDKVVPKQRNIEHYRNGLVDQYRQEDIYQESLYNL